MALSPMMQYYFTVKEQYNDAIVMFRLGDFYEMFFDDAKEASEILGLTLTGRACGLEERAPMCGIPFHALDGYLPKLIRAGKKVAICEQMNTPEEANGMVDRQVVRIVTPGTVIEDSVLDEKKSNYLASIIVNGNVVGMSWLDVSTGEFNTFQVDYVNPSQLEDILLTINPAEVIVNDNTYNILKSLNSFCAGKLKNVVKYANWAFEYSTAYNNLLRQFDVKTLIHFEIEDKKESIMTAGALINYVIETQKRSLSHIASIKYIKNSGYLLLDANSIRNLELLETMKDGAKRGSLLGVLDKTRTSMGGRLLRTQIVKPLKDPVLINERLDAVEELVLNTPVRNNLIEVLSLIKDLERLCTKVSYGNPSPRDFLAIGNTLKYVPQLKNLLYCTKTKYLADINNNLDPLAELTDLLDRSISEDCSALARDGGFIKSGYNKELDDLKNIKNTGKTLLAQIEASEKELTGIKNLKVGYTRVFGYYIEISKGNVDKVPDRYIRRQTLTTGERYITEELKEVENKLLNSIEESLKLELKIFDEITSIVMKNIKDIQKVASSIALLDCINSFAIVSNDNCYTKPIINEKVDKLEILEGRHPVVESLLKTTGYIANDTLLDNCINRTMIITGPNMGGKSTYMRQVALITIMAHMGCFVPANKAEISLTDRVFTRIGASDDVAYGQSTFMVEMLEVATILNNATYKSLLILDEIGRGTSTYDGMAIARAVVEDVTSKIRCKTLFSTHYHELTELEDIIEGVKNYKVVATEKDNTVIFLHKVMHGGTDKSFGIEVAKIAGVPKDVIKRSKEIQKLLKNISISTQRKSDNDSLDILDISKDNTLKDMIKKIDIDSLSPIQALIELKELIDIAKKS